MVSSVYHSGMRRQRKATTLRLEEIDIKALETIKQHYGIASDNQAVILAIHITVKQIEGGAPTAAAFHPHS